MFTHLPPYPSICHLFSLSIHTVTLASVHHLVQSTIYPPVSEILAFTVSVCDILLARILVLI